MSNSNRKPARSQVSSALSPTSASDSGLAQTGRGGSWLRNNWTEPETREVMEILVSEFITSDYSTAAYSKSHAPDARFQELSFDRPPRELYNKVQNLRQRFFTPHSYLLQWAAPTTDARTLKRIEKCLTNPKTRESVHSIFAPDAPEATEEYNMTVGAVQMADGDMNSYSYINTHYHGASTYIGDSTEANSKGGSGGGGGAVSVKSVNYYCDIFRRQAPDLWDTSVDAYKKFASSHELQSATGVTADAGNEQSHAGGEGKAQFKKRGRAPAVSTDNKHDQMLPMLGSPAPASQPLSDSAIHTHSPAVMADFGSDFHSDATDDTAHDSLQLMGVVGHSWHKFLSQPNRWVSLGLGYANKDDWQKQEAGFLAQHLLTLVPEHVFNSTAVMPLTMVPAFSGSFDAANIEMAVGRARSVRGFTWNALADSLLEFLELVDDSDQFTILSLCWLTDRLTQSQMSLSLLVSHGSNSQRFGGFPHNDAMFARMVAGSEGMWHEYTRLNMRHGSSSRPRQRLEDSNAGRVAFAYLQSGIRYTFFARLRGHFFEMMRDEEWAPTIKPANPRSVWQPALVARDTLLSVMHQDTEKLLTGMVELYGLGLFCHGFFDGIPPHTGPTGVAMPVNPRRISDDPNISASRRRNPSSSRSNRGRASASAMSSMGGAGNNNGYASSSGNASPYRRPQKNVLSTSLVAAAPATSNFASSNSTAIAAAAAAAAAANLLIRQPSRGNIGAPGFSGCANNCNNNGGSSSNNSSNNLGNLTVLSRYDNQFLSPQPRNFHSFPSTGDMAVMSMSLPNSPYCGLPFDNVGQKQQQQQYQNGIAASSGTPNDNMHLFSPLSDAAFIASGNTPTMSLQPDMSFLGADCSSVSTRCLNALSVATVAAAAAGIDANTLLPGNTMTGSPAFWDFSSTDLQHQMQQAMLSTPVGSTLNIPSDQISDVHSPNAQAVMAAANLVATASMRVDTSGAANFVSSVTGANGGSSSAQLSSSSSASVTIYPQGGNAAMPVWDDMAMQSLGTVLGSPDMLAQFVQPLPMSTSRHYNLSAHPAPAFDHFAQPSGAASASCYDPMMLVPRIVEDAAGSASGKVVSSTGAYFGTPVSDYNALASPFADDLNASNSRQFMQNANPGSNQQNQQQLRSLDVNNMCVYQMDASHHTGSGSGCWGDEM
ncbi:hypothetical protein LPJ66_000289 [Kickxella alabastrina]|uniref:Uncharacterized protein n=1 Tax=Kickxella alabastrina TaxID=61397 RepID=A0ACC1IWF4_9FUNG|nr:hypothetical protein LPJ66_000289 [Kickxella alabastrina]